jgi:predicted nuclease of restriction endonuclease-like (RecB) superfamily
MENQLETTLFPLFSEIVKLIDDSKSRTISQINTNLTLTYWHIGKNISIHVLQNNRADYGKQILQSLSKKLTELYGNGYSERSLARMIKFYDFFPENILPTLLAKLSWSHFIELFSIKNEVEREFYATICYNEHWSVRTLKERINSMLFERTSISNQSDKTIKNDLEKLRDKKEMSLNIVLKDPYILNFLGLADTYSERDFEQAIILELQNFILELGNDFAFLARQKRITIDQDDYYIDLLFFHRKLNRLVAIELKLGKFEYSHKAQMELYLRWLDKNERNPTENSPIGIILCSNKTEELIELLELDEKGIHVATYFTELPKIELLKLKLKQAITNSKQKIENKR